MSEPHNLGPKKSVALSGVTAGNTALCTVGRSGNDLHYRGYDILEIAAVCEFEEIAYLLIHEKLPSRAELAEYKVRLRSLRGLPAITRAAKVEALNSCSAYRMSEVCMARTQEAGGGRRCSSCRKCPPIESSSVSTSMRTPE